MNGAEFRETDRTEELVDRTVSLVFRQLEVQRTTLWAKEAQEYYNNLPKHRSRERRVANDFLTQTAAHLLQNPKYIKIACKVWEGEESQNHQESIEPFISLIKEELNKLIKEEWKTILPEQLAQLVRIYSDPKDSSQPIAQDLLKNYFKGPQGRIQRIDSYYNFMLGVLDLAGDKEAFIEGMKIVLHATDIFPKIPNIAEQTALLDFPYKEDKRVLQKLLVARRVIANLCYRDPRNLDKYYQDRANFMNRDPQVREESDKRSQQVEKAIGLGRTREMYNVMKTAMSIIATPSRQPSFLEESQIPIGGIDPLRLAFDPNDPLNQKFNQVLLERRISA